MAKRSTCSPTSIAGVKGKIEPGRDRAPTATNLPVPLSTEKWPANYVSAEAQTSIEVPIAIAINVQSRNAAMRITAAVSLPRSTKLFVLPENMRIAVKSANAVGTTAS